MTDRLLQARWGKWVLFILGWAALTLLFAPEAYLHFYLRRQPIPWRETFQLTIANSAIALLFLPAIVWLARRFPVERKTWPKALLVHLPACLLFSVGHSFLYWTACYASNQLGETLFFRFHPNLLTYWAIVGFAEAIDYFRRYTLRERELAELQLLLLRSQLHPHFLFNTLHTLSAMMHEDIRAADQMLSRLSDLLRLTLESIGQHEVSLKQELEFVQKYLEIERIRFQERLALDLDIGPDAMDALVPTMILQPLVENSVRHGFAASRREGTIAIVAKRDGDELVLRVTDNGKGFSSNGLDRRLQGLGLSNARRRLEQLYHSAHKLECTNSPFGGAVVLIQIPFHTAALQSVTALELISDETASLDRRRRTMGPKANRYALRAEADVEIVGECQGGAEAVRAITERAPDLVFLDVQMPEVGAFEVVEAIGPERMPLVILATAYDKYAIQAFDAQAIDYLLKPFDEERFKKALNRARREFKEKTPSERNLRELLESMRMGRCFLQRLVAKSGGRVLFLRATDIDWIEASGNYVTLHSGKESHVLRTTMSTLEPKLNPQQFVRIHRSAIVNLDRVREMQPWFHGEQILVLKDGTRLNVGRTFRDKLLQ